MDRVNRELLSFISASPTAFHAVEQVRRRLLRAGFTELREEESWRLRAPGAYFVCRNGSSLAAFRLPEADFPGFLIMAAHTDSPAFRIKEDSTVKAAGLYTQLNVEPYGGMLCASWMDRPLSAAGRVVVRENGKLVTKLVNIDRDLLLIPSVAIHMDREANDGKHYQPHVDMLPLLGGAETEKGLDALVAGAVGVSPEELVGKELNLYPRTPGTVWGAEEEYVSSPRLDDLQCVFGCLEGFLQAPAGPNVQVLCLFDNEEVGSGTRQGADSTFLEDVLCRLCEELGRTPAQLREALSQSFLVSADNAHAVHPNHPEHADRNDRPQLNGGVVIKYNANQRYTTDGVTAAVFAELCRRAGVPVQRYTNRADMPGGSTLGHISTAHVSVRSVDIGLAQLAMHSAYETAGARDTERLIRASAAFYGCAYRVRADETEI